MRQTKQLLIKRDEIRHVVFSLQQSFAFATWHECMPLPTYTCHHHDQPSGIVFVPPCLVTNLEIFQANRAGLHNTLLVPAEVHHYGITITPTLWGLDWSPSQNHFWNDCGVVWPTHPLNSFFQHRLPIPWNHFSNHWPPLRNHFSRSSGTSKSFLQNDFVCHELLPKK